MILGGETKSTALVEWSRRELHGYGLEDELPDYRRASAPLMMSVQSGYNVFTQQLGPEQMPIEALEWGYGEPLKLRHSLDELECMVVTEKQSLHITSPSGPRVTALLNAKIGDDDGVTTILSVYWALHVATVKGIIGRIRTVLAEFLAELITNTGSNARPSKTQVDRALESTAGIVVSNNGGSVTVVASSTGDGGTSSASMNAADTKSKKSFWASWRNRGVVVGIAAVIGTVATVATYFEWYPWK